MLLSGNHRAGLLALLALAGAATACGGGSQTASTSSAEDPVTTVAVASTTGATTTTSTSVAPSTTVPEPTTTAAPTTTAYTPANLVSMIPDEAGTEGVWTPLETVAGHTVIWRTRWHPFADRPRVVATAALFDQTRLVARHFSGSRLPERGRWKYQTRVPEELEPWLVATFNGGFMLNHITGGYMTEGVEVQPLAEGHATLGVRKADYRLVLGVYGRDMVNDGTWLTLRQNIWPFVENGEPAWQKHRAYWGDGPKGIKDTLRSALCNMPDGRMMYILAGDVDVEPFGQIVASTGCTLGIELDINGTWPHFATYSGFGTTERTGLPLERRVLDKQRMLRSSWHDFFALFDPYYIPDGTLD